MAITLSGKVRKVTRRYISASLFVGGRQFPTGLMYLMLCLMIQSIQGRGMRGQLDLVIRVEMCVFNAVLNDLTIRYDTIEEFNVDSPTRKLSILSPVLAPVHRQLVPGLGARHSKCTAVKVRDRGGDYTRSARV